MCQLLCYTIVWSIECNTIIVHNYVDIIMLTFCIVVFMCVLQRYPLASEILWRVFKVVSYVTEEEKVFSVCVRVCACVCVRVCVCVRSIIFHIRNGGLFYYLR